MTATFSSPCRSSLLAICLVIWAPLPGCLSNVPQDFVEAPLTDAPPTGHGLPRHQPDTRVPRDIFLGPRRPRFQVVGAPPSRRCLLSYYQPFAFLHTANSFLLFIIIPASVLSRWADS